MKFLLFAISYIVLTSLIFTTGNAASDTDLFFHHFDVGQGSCQLSIYNHENSGQKTKIGVMYDAGSSSQQQHVKFQQNPTMRALISSAPCSVIAKANISIDSDDDNSSSGNLSATGTEVSVKTQSREQSIADYILGKCDGLDHLFVFLSHPDRDHINLISKVVPSAVSITVFLSGDWLGNAASNDRHDNVSQFVSQVFDFLKRRDSSKTKFSLPYYYNSTLFQYSDIKSTLRETVTKEVHQSSDREVSGSVEQKLITVADLFNKFKIDFMNTRHVPEDIFRGTLGQLLNLAKEKDDLTQEEYDALTQISGMGTVLDNVYIWSLNQASDDANDQSCIVSCTFPDKNMSFVFTGDAHDLVFKKASLMGDNEGKKIQSILDSNEHLVWLTLPHHGSENNESYFAWSLFKPSGVLITAGNFERFGHPSYDLIHRISMIDSKFWGEKMQINDNNYRFLSFKHVEKPKRNVGMSITGDDSTKIDRAKRNVSTRKTGKKKNKGGNPINDVGIIIDDIDKRKKDTKIGVRMGSFQRGKMPILCPNMMGSISMEMKKELNNSVFYILQEGFSPIIEDDSGKVYVIDYIQKLPGDWELGQDLSTLSLSIDGTITVFTGKGGGIYDSGKLKVWLVTDDSKEIIVYKVKAQSLKVSE